LKICPVAGHDIIGNEEARNTGTLAAYFYAMNIIKIFLLENQPRKIFYPMMKRKCYNESPCLKPLLLLIFHKETHALIKMEKDTIEMYYSIQLNKLSLNPSSDKIFSK
jgi:hypothetical protein